MMGPLGQLCILYLVKYWRGKISVNGSQFTDHSLPLKYLEVTNEVIHQFISIHFPPIIPPIFATYGISGQSQHAVLYLIYFP